MLFFQGLGTKAAKGWGKLSSALLAPFWYMYAAGMTQQIVMLLFSIKEQEVQRGHYHITLNMVSEIFVSECSFFFCMEQFHNILEHNLKKCIAQHSGLSWSHY